MRKKNLYWLFLCGIFVIGCASFSEKIKVITGTSTKQLASLRGTAVAKGFAFNYKSCYAQSLRVLSKIGVYPFKKDYVKGVIAAYVSPQDTTEIGIFLTELDTNKTQIEIVSGNSEVKERFASKFLPALEKALSVEEKLNELIQQQENVWESGS